MLSGALESHYFLKHGEMKLFSEQQLVSHRAVKTQPWPSVVADDVLQGELLTILCVMDVQVDCAQAFDNKYQ